jgi:hypothetical protein
MKMKKDSGLRLEDDGVLYAKLNRLSRGFFVVLTLLGGTLCLAAPASHENFVDYQPDPNFHVPEIVLQYDPVAKTGVDWAAIKKPAWSEKWSDASPELVVGRAAGYLQDGLKRMTGQVFPVVSKPDLSRGIVLTLWKNATPEIRRDAAIQQALKADPADHYAANEAFYIRSEKERVLVVANTPDGLTDAVVALLEAVDYEVLGMGPNWTYAPDYRHKPLIFSLERAERPSFYIRYLGATSNQQYGAGTIMSGLTDPADEAVDVSYLRWMMGTHMYGQSMPPFPGHQLQKYARVVREHIRETGITDGLLTAKTVADLDARRPPAGLDNKDWMWINTDAKGQPGADQVYLSNGETWSLLGPQQVGWNLDLSVPYVRQLIFETMKKEAEASFAQAPDAPMIYGMEAEDGAPGNAFLAQRMKNPNWYPEYLKQEGLPFGRPYALNGYNGLNQPRETWDPAAASDNMFGLADWLLHEFDKWIDALPPEQRVTSTGKSKKELIRTSFLSYNFHDVPPDFNPDPRIRIMTADYPKHRGQGKWEKFASHEDVARALKVMLPQEPMADYRILSLAYYSDPGAEGLPLLKKSSAADLVADYGAAYDAGYRAMVAETDFNFGKYGLRYYLISKLLWNAKLTAQELDGIRDRWLQRAFGSAWKEMKAYYDFMLPENYPVNGPQSWATAIRFIDAADKKIDGTKEPDVRRRIDDVKQYWYYHYLMDSGLYTKSSPELKEYLWKGQMSYMVAMHVLASRQFGGSRLDTVKDVVGPELNAGPAHYTHEETQVWWARVLDFWKVTPVANFSSTVLANGKLANSIDLNDLVAVQEFQNTLPDRPLYFRSDYVKPVPILMIARRKGDEIGFTMAFQFKEGRPFGTRKIAYGVDIWDPVRKTWNSWIDKSTTVQESKEEVDARGQQLQVASVRLQAPRPGTYRFDIDNGGFASFLTSSAYDPATGKYANPVGFTYSSQASGLALGPVYFYIPKGTKSLDFEVWDSFKNKAIQLYHGLPAGNATASRKIDVSNRGTYTIALQPGEDGTVARVDGGLLAFPYLYSVPTLWAMSPSSLLIPRDIAEADGLTIMK